MIQTPAFPRFTYPARSQLLLTAACAALALGATACRVDEEQFNHRVFSCNVAARYPGCGVDEAGQPMKCFAARQIGATDFCASSCDVAAAPKNPDEDAPAVCLQSGVSLRTCHPSEDYDPAGHPKGACGQEDLQCYRTDLLSDTGVCTTMNFCDQDKECSDPIRSVCATTFLASLYSQAVGVMQSNHMYCLQTGCRARRTSCSAGETCLQEVIPAAAHPPDICVPDCDAQLKCPPNFLCYRKVSTSITPKVCIPGLLGFTCESDLDCMLGSCVSNGIGYSVCTTTCDTQADCQRFDGEQGKFVCIKNQANPTAPGYCQTPDSYRGSLCNTTDECIPRNADEVCSRVSASDPQGTCLIPCVDGKCGARAGINHTCLPLVIDGQTAAVCYPGYFHLPCAADSNCVGDLQCRPTGPDSPSICSIPCELTEDCAADRWIGGEGWCHPLLHSCVPKIANGKECEQPDSCESGDCVDGICVPTQGEGK